MIIEDKGITFGLHRSLIIPIAAKSKESISKYIGTIEDSFGEDDAFLVSFSPLELSNDLPVWKNPRSSWLTHSKQIWVAAESKKYRQYYLNHFKDQCINSKYVVDHIMNRKLATALGYRYIRLLHVSRSSNSSSGRGGETFAKSNLPIGQSINPDINSTEIVYADPSDLLKMLDMQVGGFGLDAVRDNHYLFYPTNINLH